MSELKLKEKLKKGIEATADWVDKNKAVIIGGLVIGVGLMNEGNKMIKNANRAKSIRQEKMLNDRYIYDRSAGVYLKTRRAMRPEERVEFSIRKRRGESPVSILRSMRLL